MPPTTPQSEPGDTTFWHSHFWGFASAYHRHRFDIDYSLSAEHSLDLCTGNTQTPIPLIIISGKGGNCTVQLSNGTALVS